MSHQHNKTLVTLTATRMTWRTLKQALKTDDSKTLELHVSHLKCSVNKENWYLSVFAAVFGALSPLLL